MRKSQVELVTRPTMGGKDKNAPNSCDEWAVDKFGEDPKLSDRCLRSQLIPHIRCHEDAGTSALQSVSSLALSQASGKANFDAFEKEKYNPRNENLEIARRKKKGEGGGG